MAPAPALTPTRYWPDTRFRRSRCRHPLTAHRAITAAARRIPKPSLFFFFFWLFPSVAEDSRFLNLSQVPALCCAGVVAVATRRGAANNNLNADPPRLGWAQKCVNTLVPQARTAFCARVLPPAHPNQRVRRRRVSVVRRRLSLLAVGRAGSVGEPVPPRAPRSPLENDNDNDS